MARFNKTIESICSTRLTLYIYVLGKTFPNSLTSWAVNQVVRRMGGDPRSPSNTPNYMFMTSDDWEHSGLQFRREGSWTVLVKSIQYMWCKWKLKDWNNSKTSKKSKTKRHRQESSVSKIHIYKYPTPRNRTFFVFSISQLLAPSSIHLNQGRSEHHARRRDAFSGTKDHA